MPKNTLIVDYLVFLKDIGMLYWNTRIMEVLKQSFTVSMLAYDENIMC